MKRVEKRRGVYKEVGEETESESFSEERWSAKGEKEEIIWEVSLYVLRDFSKRKATTTFQQRGLQPL